MTGEQRAEQRAEWKRALAALAAVQRNARYRRKPPRLKAGMLRKEPQRQERIRKENDHD